MGLQLSVRSHETFWRQDAIETIDFLFWRHDDVVKRLVDHKADINALTPSKKTALSKVFWGKTWVEWEEIGNGKSYGYKYC